jgi:hypothetical protein
MLQTLGTYEGKQMVLAVTLSDGNNVKYFISFRRFEYAVHSDSLKHASNESGSPCGSKAYIVGVFLEHRRTNAFQFLSSAVLVHYLRITIECSDAVYIRGDTAVIVFVLAMARREARGGKRACLRYLAFIGLRKDKVVM